VRHTSADDNDDADRREHLYTYKYQHSNYSADEHSYCDSNQHPYEHSYEGAD
jgi:hypothetical protein